MAPFSVQKKIRSEADAVKALSAMRRSNVSRRMVVENDQLAGIIAFKDMLECLSLKVAHIKSPLTIKSAFAN